MGNYETFQSLKTDLEEEDEVSIDTNKQRKGATTPQRRVTTSPTDQSGVQHKTSPEER